MAWWTHQNGSHIPKQGFGAVHEPRMEYEGTVGGNKVYACTWPECDVREIWNRDDELRNRRR